MIYARQFMYAVLLLVASFSIQGTQATLTPPIGNLLAVPTAYSSSPSLLSSAMLSFQPFPPPISCNSTTISWSYSGLDDPMILQVTNVGVPQNATPPTTSSSSIATTSSIAIPTVSSVPISPQNLTILLAIDYAPILQSYFWNPVNVSQGWYILVAIIPIEGIVQSSSPFFVRTETNTSCLGSVAVSSPTPSPSPPSSSASPNSSLPIPASDLSSASTSKVPTIIGVTLGMTVFVIGSVIIWIALRRRSRARSGNSKNNSRRWNQFYSTDQDSRGGFGADATTNRYKISRSHLTAHPGSIATTIGLDFEADIVGAEKSPTQPNLKALNLADEQDVALNTLPVLHHQLRTRPDHTCSASSSTLDVNTLGFPVNNRSSRRYSTQRPISSAVYPPSFVISSREPAQDMAPNISRSSSLNTTDVQHSSSFSNQTSAPPPASPLTSFQFPPPSPTASRETKQMNRQSLSRKRKPVPVYDASGEEPTSASFTNPPPSPFPANGDSVALSPKSSFGPGGIEGKPLHYLIPDLPIAN